VTSWPAPRELLCGSAPRFPLGPEPTTGDTLTGRMMARGLRFPTSVIQALGFVDVCQMPLDRDAPPGSCSSRSTERKEIFQHGAGPQPGPVNSGKVVGGDARRRWRSPKEAAKHQSFHFGMRLRAGIRQFLSGRRDSAVSMQRPAWLATHSPGTFVGGSLRSVRNQCQSRTRSSTVAWRPRTLGIFRKTGVVSPRLGPPMIAVSTSLPSRLSHQGWPSRNRAGRSRGMDLGEIASCALGSRIARKEARRAGRLARGCVLWSMDVAGQQDQVLRGSSAAVARPHLGGNLAGVRDRSTPNAIAADLPRRHGAARLSEALTTGRRSCTRRRG